MVFLYYAQIGAIYGAEGCLKKKPGIVDQTIPGFSERGGNKMKKRSIAYIPYYKG